MEKLELKYLAGYLPYDVKIARFTHEDIYKRIEYSLRGNNIDEVVQYNNLKPILRPLSDLTKEIEVNGMKFVPIDLLNERFRPSSKDLSPYQSVGYNLELEIQTENYSQMIDLFDGFLIVTQLLEWHFAINIPEHLYIDINTIK